MSLRTSQESRVSQFLVIKLVLRLQPSKKPLIPGCAAPRWSCMSIPARKCATIPVRIVAVEWLRSGILGGTSDLSVLVAKQREYSRRNAPNSVRAGWLALCNVMNVVPIASAAPAGNSQQRQPQEPCRQSDQTLGVSFMWTR